MPERKPLVQNLGRFGIYKKALQVNHKEGDFVKTGKSPTASIPYRKKVQKNR